MCRFKVKMSKVKVMRSTSVCFLYACHLNIEGHMIFDLQVLHEKHNLFGQGNQLHLRPQLVNA